MAPNLHNKSLDRGLTIMELLAREGAASLSDLHRRSGIPKSSIRRLLATLTDRRLVRKSFADGKYRIDVIFPVSAGEPRTTEHAYALDVAMPIISRLTREIEWPSDIHLLDGERMRVVDSTRPLSPFHLYRGVVNRQVNIFGSATGMVCLAEMGDREFRRIAAHTERDPKWGLARLRLSEAQYLDHVRATRARGYGARIPGMVGEDVFNDGLAAIARPFYAGSNLLGAVSLLWPKVFLTTEEFAERYLPALREATDEIDRALAAGATRT